MKNNDRTLSWPLLILLVFTISIGFRQATGRAEEHFAGETSGSDQIPSQETDSMSKMFAGKVVEVIDGSRHIYVHIDTGEQQVWIAVPSFTGKPGDKVLVPPGLPVADFQSNELNRMFKMIYFVGGIHLVDKNTSD